MKVRPRDDTELELVFDDTQQNVFYVRNNETWMKSLEEYLGFLLEYKEYIYMHRESIKRAMN